MFKVIKFYFVAVMALSFLTAIINAQTDVGLSDVKEYNATITCEINGVQKSGDECIESLKKFGKIVGYIISGVIISIICCCCLCWCCICKAIYSNKRGGQNGQVLHHNNPRQPYGINAVENPAIATVA